MTYRAEELMPGIPLLTRKDIGEILFRRSIEDGLIDRDYRGTGLI